MKFNINKGAKYNFKNIETKRPQDVVGDVSFNIAFELLKIIVLLFITVSFALLQYKNPIETNVVDKAKFIKEIYLYTIGLAFGDLTIFILIGFYFTFVIRWVGLAYKDKYFKWFKTHQKVDYWNLKNRITITVWVLLFAIAAIYHSVLVFQRMDNAIIYKVQTLKNIYVKGWYYSFTNNGLKDTLPVASGNLGIFFDSILNLLYLTFSPFLAWILIILVITFAILKLMYLRPLIYLKNLNCKKLNLYQIESYLKRHNALFYYTDETKRYFAYLKKTSDYLQITIDQYSLKALIKIVNEAKDKLSTIERFQEFFKNVKNNDHDKKEESSELVTKEFEIPTKKIELNKKQQQESELKTTDLVKSNENKKTELVNKIKFLDDTEEIEISKINYKKDILVEKQDQDPNENVEINNIKFLDEDTQEIQGAIEQNDKDNTTNSDEWVSPIIS